MKRLLQIFGSRYASVFCILFAITNRIIFATLYSTIGRDARMQITFAKNLIAGKGLGVTKFFTTDLNTPIFDTTQHFPPGFSLAIVPFLKLFGDDEYKAVFVFDIATIFLFLFAVRFLSKMAGLPLAMQNILLLIIGCAQYAFIMHGSSSDLVGLALLCLGLGILIKIVDKDLPLKLTTLFFYGLIFFLPSFFRYMYLPVSLLFPVIISAFGVLNKSTGLKKAGVKLFAVVGLFIFLMLFLSYQYGGNSVYVFETARGIFFNQLIHWYPFIPASFVNLDFIAQIIAKISGISYTGAFKIFEIANIILLAFLLLILIRFLSFFKKQRPTPSSTFIVSGAMISLSILGLLTYFSLTYKPQLYGIYLWNYNYESRYFAFIYIFLPIVLLLLFSVYSPALKNLFFRFLAFAGACLLCFEVMHGVYYNIKIATRHDDLIVIKNRVADYKQFPAMLLDLSEKYPDRELMVTASDQVFLNTASEMGYKAIFDYTSLNTTMLYVQKKSILLFPLHETDEWLMKEYIVKRKPRLMTKLAGTLFYIEEINP